MIQTIQLRILAILGLTLLGCDAVTQSRQSAAAAEKRGDASVATAKSVVDPKFERVALAAAGEYKNWSMVDDAWRWAPTLCADASPTRNPRLSQLRQSASADAGTHGRKMYRVFAKDGEAYAKLSEGIAPSTPRAAEGHAAPAELKSVTQVIVKESWIPQHAAEPAKASAPAAPAATKQMKQSDLFMMLRVGGEKEAGTDEGWVYATVTPDGKEATGAGRKENCMKCHAEAPHGRLFGLKPVITK